ncbi:hypothetical protein FBY35_3320 [Streptomyces sp. SLBN-118]|uniref:hypothetical protein n=1 Tax=Streptomyces sp. SLBN-118 TaxID=2768454 RepID=UPI00115485B8|nr:hypothetical protein [Streptomyces sp. SLBN-118]TQK52864.1 hypothetical protein FBY35_3320 [Streptomyces sp. SLBN-118]
MSPSGCVPAASAAGTAESVRTALLATAALLAGVAAAALLLLDSDYLDEPGDQDTTAIGLPPSTGATPSPSSASPRPTATPDYTVPYTNLELTSPDSDYEIDLKTGRVSRETPAWFLGREAGEFYIPDDSAAYIPPVGTVTLPDCLQGLDTQPASALPFTTLRADRSFCVRAYGGREIAIIRILNTPSDDGPVNLSITYYRRST